MSRLPFLLGSLFLSGCVSSQIDRPRTQWQQLQQLSHQCFLDLKNDSQLESIAHKVTLDRTYDRDLYFKLAGINATPAPDEQIAIRKWEAKLKTCYKLKAKGYAYEPASVAKWSREMDGEQLALVHTFSGGRLSYGEFAARRLEIDTRYRSEITGAISADYKRPEDMQQKKANVIQSTPSDPWSACGWEGAQWICRSL